MLKFAAKLGDVTLRDKVNQPEAVRSYEKKRQVRNLKPQAPSTARPRA
jgi:hypothetical protein